MYNSQCPFSIIEATASGNCFGYDLTDMGCAHVSALMSNTKFESELKRWNTPSRFPKPILINAPTGAGKTHFVCTELAEFAKEQGRSILFLSNRRALNMQTREILSKSNESPAFSSDVLNTIIRYGNLVVGTYHSIDTILSKLQNDPIQQTLPIGYVVLDEIHFLASDALFNAQTSYIFTKILNAFPSCQRIYLSATPQEVRDIIACEEYRLYHLYIHQNDHTYLRSLSNPIKNISEYLFQADYSYINLHFCDSLDDLCPKIKASKDKWLIFVSKKSDGESFSDTLNKKLGVAAFYVDADKRNSSPEIRRKLGIIIEHEKFKEKALIATSLLDNGINFHDPELKNIVVDSVDPIQVKQMIGRKRLDASETVKVYIVKHNQKEIQSYLKDARTKVTLLNYYRQNPQQFIQEKFFNLTEAERGLFQPTHNPYSQNFTLVVNGYAQYKLACMIHHYEHLDGLLEMEGEGALEREIAGWFGIEDGNWNNIEEVFAEIQKQALAIINQYKLAPAETDSEELKNLDRQLWDLVQPIVDKYKIKHDTESVGKGENIRKIMQALGLPYDIKKSQGIWCIKDKEAPEIPLNEQP